MPKISVYIATSLDGFIARKDGDIEWLHTSGQGKVASDEDFGYKVFMENIDVLLMGRNTFEKVLSFGGEWPYGKKPVIVLTSRAIEIPKEISETVSSMSGSPEEIVSALDQQGFEDLYLDGGFTIQRFLEAGLVNELTVTRIPILIGEGIPLFGPLTEDIPLKHLETQSWNNGFVQSRYKVLSGAS
ncbi:dihydrofolate reductase family protein [Gracilimonas mengyeensis]|uniref:Dihydrofolate reductase n=1 Tax=Gracilimonas mengyeensis TaxID=1302730 RepID=A0A521FDV9_9BACT|nr:dihydrofolate reductase family protein [Gracilimonas mengyeensis]SMO93821.1 Dihydrofolate reductase [Gracilimonas mengyeensis]